MVEATASTAAVAAGSWAEAGAGATVGLARTAAEAAAVVAAAAEEYAAAESLVPVSVCDAPAGSIPAAASVSAVLRMHVAGEEGTPSVGSAGLAAEPVASPTVAA